MRNRRQRRDQLRSRWRRHAPRAAMAAAGCPVFRMADRAVRHAVPGLSRLGAGGGTPARELGDDAGLARRNGCARHCRIRVARTTLGGALAIVLCLGGAWCLAHRALRLRWLALAAAVAIAVRAAGAADPGPRSVRGERAALLRRGRGAGDAGRVALGGIGARTPVDVEPQRARHFHRGDRRHGGGRGRAAACGADDVAQGRSAGHRNSYSSFHGCRRAFRPRDMDLCWSRIASAASRSAVSRKAASCCPRFSPRRSCRAWWRRRERDLAAWPERCAAASSMR